jgi:2,3-bisphosphoglycerate-independent phosphoglycerate mutase
MYLPRPVMLVILDGWGLRDDPSNNAVRQARTPNFDRLWRSCPRSSLRTSGLDVGLPRGQMGNSEVGHLNIGAGRVVMQELPRIDEAIRDGSLAQATTFKELVRRMSRSGGTCHLLALISPGGVHAHQSHAAWIGRQLAESGVRVAVHAFTDGRDTDPKSAARYLADFRRALPPGIPIATVSGRYFAMDRDNRWERVEAAYRAISSAEGKRFENEQAVLSDAYSRGLSDEFITPAIVADYGGMKDGDALLCAHFRADRVRELLTAFLDPEFDGFVRGTAVSLVGAVGMSSYGQKLDKWMETILRPQSLKNMLGEAVAKAGRTQLRMAETEKYPHVTYFLNGGFEPPYPGEDRIMVPSPKVATYDLKPEMAAPELTDRALEAITSAKYDMIVLNYANPDMVGHTGSLPAAVKAVETVDAGLGRIAGAIAKVRGALLVTADHGNCETMFDQDSGNPHTAHTANPVPVVLAGVPAASLSHGRLADVAPTLLTLLQLPIPDDMTGRSLF